MAAASEKLAVAVVHPVLRGGRVLDAQRNLDFEASYDLACFFAKRSSFLRETVVIALSDVGCERLEYPDRDGAIKRRESPIVDFVQFRFEYLGRLWFGRLSLTVCVKERQSKIWVRVGPDINSADAIATYSDLTGIWVACMTLRETLLPALQAFYDHGLREKFGENPMRVSHDLDIAVLDFCDNAADRLISSCLRGVPLSQTMDSDAECKHVWQSFTRIFFSEPPFGKDHDQYVSLRDCRFDLVPKNTPMVTSLAADERGVYVPSFGERIRYFGFSSAAKSQREGADRWDRVAFHVSGMFVNEVATVF